MKENKIFWALIAGVLIGFMIGTGERVRQMIDSKKGKYKRNEVQKSERDLRRDEKKTTVDNCEPYRYQFIKSEMYKQFTVFDRKTGVVYQYGRDKGEEVSLAIDLPQAGLSFKPFVDFNRTSRYTGPFDGFDVDAYNAKVDAAAKKTTVVGGKKHVPSKDYSSMSDAELDAAFNGASHDDFGDVDLDSLPEITDDEKTFDASTFRFDDDPSPVHSASGHSAAPPPSRPQGGYEFVDDEEEFGEIEPVPSAKELDKGFDRIYNPKTANQK